MNKLKIGGATVNQTPLDWQSNLKNIIDSIDAAKKDNFDVVCFPELTITGYGCQDLFLGHWISHKSLDLLFQIIPHTDDIFVAVGLPVVYDNKVFNCVAAVADKELLGLTAKQNLPIDGVHYETRWFKAWEQGVVSTLEKDGRSISIGDLIYDYKGIKIGFEICEDAWIADEDRPGLRLRERKVDLVMNPSASHFALGKSFERMDLVAKSSKTFDCVYVYANLCGNEAGRMIYEGDILLAADGQMLSKSNNTLSYLPYHVHGVEIDFDQTEYSSDNSVEEYENNYSREEEFTEAISLGLFDYLRKSHSRGFVLSLSGGADSSSCAVLVSEMVRRGLKELGSDQFLSQISHTDIRKELNGQNLVDDAKVIIGHLFFTAYQGTKNSSDATLNSARELAEEIGAQFFHWTVDGPVESYTRKIEDVLNLKLDWENHDIPLQNIQSRARSPIIWMLANLKNCLLITTSNRSEGDVGYATMDGDTSGSLAPIAAIDKSFIRSWLKFAEANYDYSSLRFVNSLQPTAELRPRQENQTDEDDLMPYDLLLAIEQLAIRDHQDPVSVFRNLVDRVQLDEEVLKNYIIKFFKLWSQNQWKRERLAPSFHLESFNVDPKTWCRFPIISAGFTEELKELAEL